MRRSGRTTRMLLRVLLHASENSNARLLIVAGNASWTFSYLLRFLEPIEGWRCEAPMKVKLPNGSTITVVPPEHGDRLHAGRAEGSIYYDHFQGSWT